MSGAYNGSIKFESLNDETSMSHYLWYGVRMRVKEPACKDVIDVECNFGGAVTIEIPVTNSIESEVN